LSGSYPSLAIAAIQPADVLKVAQKSGTGGHGTLRKILIIFQFAISIFLVIGTMVVYDQMKYANSQNFGLDREEVIVIQLTDPTPAKLFRTYKSTVLQNPNIISVSASFSAPATLVQQARVEIANSGTDNVWQVQAYFGEFDLIETLGLEILEGRTFTQENPGDTLRSFLINETAVKAFGFDSNEEAIGEELQFAGNANRWQIIGIVNDFQSMSVREQIPPTILGYSRNGFFAFVRINLANVEESIQWLEKSWAEIIPGYTFDYSFLDQDFAALYQGERVLNKLLTYFAVLAIFIACLGLLGLTSFTAQQRAKEIGIRKVMGSSVAGIIFLLTKDFTRLVGIGFLIAAPIAYLIMNDWLTNFVFHTYIGPEVFIVAGASGLAATWITVSYQTLKAASANPVKSLRHE